MKLNKGIGKTWDHINILLQFLIRWDVVFNDIIIFILFLKMAECLENGRPGSKCWAEDHSDCSSHLCRQSELGALWILVEVLLLCQ